MDSLLELINRAKNGHSSAFAELFGRYRPLIINMSDKYRESASKCGIDTEDLSQEAAIALYSAIRTYNGNDEVTFGLYAKICIKNRIISLLKKNSASDVFYGEGPQDNVEADLVSDPEQSFIDRENYQKLLCTIDNTLSGLERAVFKLYLSDKSYSEISCMLGIKEKSVNNAMCRIRSKLSRLFGKN